MPTEPSESPLVSVLVPFFNSEAHLAACIEALLAQEEVGGPYEVILIDNGGSDGSTAIAESFSEVTLLAESEPGAYAARNAGLGAARAPLIAFTDADCVADPDWLRRILDAMADPSIGALIGHCRYPDEASWPLRRLGDYENAKAEYILNHCPADQRIAYANNMVVRAALFEELGPFRTWRRAADSEWVHRLANRRPDLQFRFEPAMRITHREFLRARDRARRLSLYTETNSKIEGFRELSIAQRLAVLLSLLRPR